MQSVPFLLRRLRGRLSGSDARARALAEPWLLVPPGTKVEWIADDHVHPCPDGIMRRVPRGDIGFLICIDGANRRPVGLIVSFEEVGALACDFGAVALLDPLEKRGNEPPTEN